MPFKVLYWDILLVRPRKLIARCAILSHEPKITEVAFVSSPPRSPPSEGFHLATTQVVTPFHDIVFIMSAVALIINNEPAFQSAVRIRAFITNVFIHVLSICNKMTGKLSNHTIIPDDKSDLQARGACHAC